MNIWVNGCFDILHNGHLNLLQSAKHYKHPRHMEKGEVNTLYVGIDSDRRIKELKGNNRPINNQEDRKRMLKSLRFVDNVFIYDTDEELCSLIEGNKIDLMIIGEDYKGKKVIGSEKSKYGVEFFPKDVHSTTNIIEKIKRL